MSSSPPDMRQLAAAGMEAMRRGDPKTARGLFEQVLAAGGAPRKIQFALAVACRAMNDIAATHAAIDHILKEDPYNIRALMMKGDCYARQGDARAAASYYTAVTSLAPEPDTLPPEIAAEIRRAQAACAGYAREMLAHVKRAIAAAGYDETTSSRRFTESIEMLAGVKRRYIEEPKSYYFPNLPARGFYERHMFAWVSALEAATEDIGAELSAALDEADAFEPYVRAEQDRPNMKRHKLLDDPSWGALYLWRHGELVAENAARFPRTVAALERASLDHAEGRAPLALFSRLAPGARIEPHTGLLNTRLICHLPIIVPGKCYLRVGNETREWKRGEMLIFNDTIEHEAWNDSAEPRIILLFSVWRPEMSEEERKLAAAVISSALYFADGED